MTPPYFTTALPFVHHMFMATGKEFFLASGSLPARDDFVKYRFPWIMHNSPQFVFTVDVWQQRF